MTQGSTSDELPTEDLLAAYGEAGANRVELD